VIKITIKLCNAFVHVRLHRFSCTYITQPGIV